MVSQLWGQEGPDVDWAVASHATSGQRVDLVCQIACWDYICNDCLVVIFPGNKTARLSGLEDLQEGTQAISVLDSLCVMDGNFLAFCADELSTVVEHATIHMQHFNSMLELCCGAGIATFGFSNIGIEASLAVELSGPLADAYRFLHPGVSVGRRYHGSSDKDSYL